ncbi:hypothetical protein PFICI_02650 [Pestalotiopsis fici W106-1]|uniref:Rhodopsin domain-containing protein n=1 Tax=Pestalotiopsis fici (strain W106-1 / CGMCC3.15140) TaxID=1229662 RepID=W3XF03_PESFW|nr:uncharacterized protein PFICI_02650 [Pestalotiopsis fici W106-1]ETS84625.1 hypothetical protein PFICI_02650 [Pestalotiopsis fici W106-1]
MPDKGKTYESITIQNSGQIGMIAACSVCIVVPTVLVSLRFIARQRYSGLPLDASDICIAAALLFVLALCIVDYLMVFKGGFTFDLTEIAERFGPDALTIFFKCMAAWPLLWNSCVLTSKLSVLAMYMTLMPVPRMILAVKCVGTFVILYNVSGFITGLAICRPYSKNYDWQGTVEGSCGDVKVYYEWLSAINVVSDVVILLLPLPFVYNLQMALKKKLVLFGMFGIGFMTCAVTIYRQTLLPSLDNANPTGTGLLAFLFSTVEIAVAVSLACVPFLRPLFRGTFGGSSADNSKYKTDASYAFSNKGTKAHHSQGFKELEDDGSEIQLQPVDLEREIGVTVETTWKVEPAGGDTARSSVANYQATASSNNRL